MAEGEGAHAALDKIGDSGLKSFAASDDPSANKSVIIELAATATAVPTASRSVPRRGQGSRFAMARQSSELEHSGLMDELERQIARQIAGKSVRLNAAEAFVVNVTPRQLRALCKLKLVGSVRPNRVHKI